MSALECLTRTYSAPAPKLKLAAARSADPALCRGPSQAATARL